MRAGLWFVIDFIVALVRLKSQSALCITNAPHPAIVQAQIRKFLTKLKNPAISPGRLHIRCVLALNQ